MARIKAQFFLPLSDNDGSDLGPEIEAVKDALYIEFGGWTFQGYVKGAFLMSDQTRSIDTSASYFVVIEEKKLPKLEAILREFRAKTLQEAIYLEIVRDVDVRFVQ